MATIQRGLKGLMGKCFFCGEDSYELLDTHRILYGEQGGKYHQKNILITCANCHRRIHNEKIIIDKKYTWSKAGFMVHYWMDGVEYWTPESQGHKI